MLKVTTLIFQILVVDLVFVGFLVDWPIDGLEAGNSFRSRSFLELEFGLGQLHQRRHKVIVDLFVVSG